MGPEYGPDWYVSWHNFDGQPAPDERPAFVVHDVTLRDGEQQAGIVFTGEEKIEIAKALDELGVDRIEAGMVAVSEEDRQAIGRMNELGLSAEIWTICRALPKDVKYALDAGVAGTGIILNANEQFCEIFGWTLETAVGQALEAGASAREGGLKTMLLVLDSTRMAPERLEHIIRAGTQAGVFDSIALMDTFGVLSPIGAKNIVTRVRGLTDLPVELHAHNDFGLATANALAGLEAGAHAIHTSVLGLGERIGNTPLEEIALASRLLYGFKHDLRLDRIKSVSALVQRLAGIPLSPNKPVIGETYTRIESGTVASEYARWSAAGREIQWLFPFVPSLIGAPEVELVIGKGSGAANVDAALAQAGLELTDDQKRELLLRIKDEAVAAHRLLTADEFSDLARAVSSNGAGVGAQ